MPLTNKKISQLTPATVVEANYIIPIVDPNDLSETFRATKELFNRNTVSTYSTDTDLTEMDEVVEGDTTGASVTFTLPDATTCEGRSYLIQKIAAANSLIIDTTSSQTINGSLTQTLTTLNSFLTLYSDGANWVAQIASTVTTLTGEVSGTGTGTVATVVSNAAVIGKVLTGFTSASGTVAATDTILQAFNKIDGNVALKAPLASPAFTGTVTGVTALKNLTTEVSTAAATAPTTGQVLTATSSTTATWQTPSSGGRGDAVLEVDASDGASVDFITAETVIFNMDSNLTNFTPAVLPTVDGQKLTTIFKTGLTAYTAAPDATRFRGNMDLAVPNPLLDGSLGTRDHFFWRWNNTDQFYTLIGFIRRDP